MKKLSLDKRFGAVQIIMREVNFFVPNVSLTTELDNFVYHGRLCTQGEDSQTFPIHILPEEENAC
jgi:hypothetical protein